MDDLTDITAKVVAAYVGHHTLPIGELPNLIRGVHHAFQTRDEPSVETAAIFKLTPAQIRKSITPERIFSFEDGRPYAALRRHLTARGLTPDGYRSKWGLPDDYPMVAASYSAKRSALAKSAGLGLKPVVTTGGQRKPRASRKAQTPGA